MKTSHSTESLKQSGIRAASSHCAAINGINLGQGICDIPIELAIKEAAYSAIESDKSIYSPCEGILSLRQSISKKLLEFNKVNYDPAKEILVSHGATGAFVCAIETLLNPSDEVIIFEPFYGYHKHILELKGMTVKGVSLNMNDLTFEPESLASAINNKTRAIIICTPNNPSGKVYSKEELLFLGNFAKKHNLWIITDEIYEYITYPGFTHTSMAALSDFRERTITISGFSKTFHMTGWRLGYAAGPAQVISKMALVQDLLYVCPSTPLQHAGISALSMPTSYYDNMAKSYLEKRDYVVSELQKMGFKIASPQGAYYLMVNFSNLKFENDEVAAKFLLEQAKVAVVPGRYFFINPERGKHLLRFCYALDKNKLSQAMKQLSEAITQSMLAA